MNEITVDAVIKNVDVVTDFVNEILERHNCPIKVQVQVDIAIDELFGIIARYAYKDKVGQATVKVELKENPKEISIIFVDSGIPYNPLEKEDPDVTLSAEERKVGGLGIYMVKKSMDEISYTYCNGQNQLVIKKYIHS